MAEAPATANSGRRVKARRPRVAPKEAVATSTTALSSTRYSRRRGGARVRRARRPLIDTPFEAFGDVPHGIPLAAMPVSRLKDIGPDSTIKAARDHG